MTKPGTEAQRLLAGYCEIPEKGRENKQESQDLLVALDFEVSQGAVEVRPDSVVVEAGTNENTWPLGQVETDPDPGEVV
ncbi:hypothetical protein NDU88_000329 [Pleurodeles waltl]|uniref:Uncharacterized protein n=1 Tax=Pleurodeles waltl TaxID=8319 RepID=A0AAV7VY31_PLEWA|nr:hypothetical protein NDU88_000329 [Pleurodeles waltl]